MTVELNKNECIILLALVKHYNRSISGVIMMIKEPELDSAAKDLELKLENILTGKEEENDSK